MDWVVAPTFLPAVADIRRRPAGSAPTDLALR
jgi:hypothetical protein